MKSPQQQWAEKFEGILNAKVEAAKDSTAVAYAASVNGKSFWHGNPDRDQQATHSYFNLHGNSFSSDFGNYLNSQQAKKLGITTKADQSNIGIIGFSIPNNNVHALEGFLDNFKDTKWADKQKATFNLAGIANSIEMKARGLHKDKPKEVEKVLLELEKAGDNYKNKQALSSVQFNPHTAECILQFNDKKYAKEIEGFVNRHKDDVVAKGVEVKTNVEGGALVLNVAAFITLSTILDKKVRGTHSAEKHGAAELMSKWEGILDTQKGRFDYDAKKGLGAVETARSR